MLTAGSPELGLANRARWSWADQETLSRLLTAYDPITLAEMTNAALLDRAELKFVMPQTLLLPVLAGLGDSYRVLVVGEQPFSHYRTLYFDTADLTMYRRHHAGAPDRYKVRAREYVDSRAAFLEVKHKTGAQRTVKDRIPTEAPVTALPPQARTFLAQACPYPAEALHATLWNHYTRITLVSKQRPERVTLDMGLAFAHNDACATLPGIVVAEVKYAGDRRASEFARLMRHYRVRGASFSKYCMGVSLLYPDVKHNRFKAEQRRIERLTGAVPPVQVRELRSIDLNWL